MTQEQEFIVTQAVRNYKQKTFHPVTVYLSLNEKEEEFKEFVLTIMQNAASAAVMDSEYREELLPIEAN